MSAIGQLKEISAWVDRMPPGPPTLHVIGKITAPTPCHAADAAYVGDTKDNPPQMMLKVTIRDTGAICIQKVSDIEFRYKRDNYAGNHDRVVVSSDTDSQIVEIETVR